MLKHVSENEVVNENGITLRFFTRSTKLIFGQQFSGILLRR
jgi:hypothetical protein